MTNYDINHNVQINIILLFYLITCSSCNLVEYIRKKYLTYWFQDVLSPISFFLNSEFSSVFLQDEVLESFLQRHCSFTHLFSCSLSGLHNNKHEMRQNKPLLKSRLLSSCPHGRADYRSGHEPFHRQIIEKT